MEEFDLVEADFQQYYRLNLEDIYSKMYDPGVGFLRYARLFANLPPDSRIMKKLLPEGSWSWENETMSRMLYELSAIQATLYNINRKKGSRAVKPDEQLQPDYVKKAKEEYLEYLKDKERQEEHQNELKAFFSTRNPDVKMS